MKIDLSEQEVAQSVIAAHGAIHTLVTALIERKAISAHRGAEALELLASGNNHSAKTLADTISQLKQLALLEAKGP